MSQQSTALKTPFYTLEAFLLRNNFPTDGYVFLAGDASFRKYYRVYDHESKPFVVMHAPYPEDPRPFIEIATLLKEKGFLVPTIYDAALEEGYLLLSDLGDDLLSRVLTPQTQESFYKSCVDLLQEVYLKTQTSTQILAYDIDTFLKEALVFYDWYALDTLKADESEQFLKSYQEVCRKLLEKALEVVPSCLVLRDFHVDNILVQKEGAYQFALLDFQDARFGPCVYDFVSLIQDARRDISPSLQKKLWQYYLSFFVPSLHQPLYEVGLILSALRHLKIIGIFNRLHKRDNKDSYLKHLPRVWAYLEDCLKEECLKDLKELLKKYDLLSKGA